MFKGSLETQEKLLLNILWERVLVRRPEHQEAKTLLAEGGSTPPFFANCPFGQVPMASSHEIGGVSR